MTARAAETPASGQLRSITCFFRARDKEIVNL
jgi:hypothetical protein